MKFSSVVCAFALSLSTSALAAVVSASYKPVKISYESLLLLENHDDVATSAEQESLLLGALHTVGMVTITNIPGMKDLKERVLSWDLHECAAESSTAKASRYPDGTERLTFATHTLPGALKADLTTGNAKPGVCEAFVSASDPFREKIAHVTQLFASRLSSALAARASAPQAPPGKEESGSGPLLATKDRQVLFHTVADVVENGEHLEHFHSYQHVTSSETSSLRKQNTIDLHTDQGLFLVFSPGRFVHKDSKEASLATGFFVDIRQDDGSNNQLAEVDFDDEDDLAIVLGDGVNQYINPHYQASEATAADRQSPALLLRALPHALAVPVHLEHQARVWYGRMVLPPSSALHPWHPETTFGEIRQALAKVSSPSTHTMDKENVLSLGCSSSSSMMVVTPRRHLDEMEACAEDTLMCWHRCMNLTEYNVSQAICEAQGKELFCINPRGQLWNQTHGDFYPGCATNDTEIATPFPTLPDYPRDEQICSNASFDEFVASFTPSYGNKFDLGQGAIFLWNVTKDDNGSGSGRVQGRIVFNGLLGFLAFGLANVGGAKNGMHGANILMAIPGGDYSPTTGFNLSMDPSVQQYEISNNPDQSSYRFWMADTNESSAESRNMEEGQDAQLTTKLDLTDCFSSFAFDAGQIHGFAFNVSGVDELLWAANNIDYYAGYHGTNRGRFSIDWTTGVAKLYDAAAAAEDDGNDSTSGAATVGVLSSFKMLMMVWLSIATATGILIAV